MRHIKVERIDTLKLGSDHRAVIYVCKVRGRAWVLITYNMGGRATGADVVQLITIAEHLAPGCWTLCLQETGDQRTTLRGVLSRVNAVTPRVELVNSGGRFWQRQGKGKLTTFVPIGTLMTDGLVPLTPRSWVGLPGAGLSPWLAPKWTLRTRQRVGGVVIRVGNVHHVSSAVAQLVRRPLHRRQVNRSMRWAKAQPDVPTAVIGDWNSTPTSVLLRDLDLSPFVLHGKPSHGSRAIDLLAVN